MRKPGQPKGTPPPMRRDWRGRGRYLLALLNRFRITFVLAAGLLVGGPLLYIGQYRPEEGGRLTFGEALHHVYFLLFGQPSLPYVENWFVEALNILIPPFGIAVVVDGIVRFAYLYFAKHRSDKEWIEVLSQTLEGHVVVCGAGRIGYRVVSQLLHLGEQVVVIEKREDAQFVSALRDLRVPVLIDDAQTPHALERTNAARAAALVCATDDDLANLNVALDARRLNPGIRVVMRLFDADLARKIRTAFDAETLSSSALAGPTMALAALDPRILHSFELGPQLLVVSEFTVGEPLTGLSVAELRDRFGALILSAQRPGEAIRYHPAGDWKVQPGELLSVQCTWEDYRRLRTFTGEAKVPLHHLESAA